MRFKLYALESNYVLFDITDLTAMLNAGIIEYPEAMEGIFEKTPKGLVAYLESNKDTKLLSEIFEKLIANKINQYESYQFTYDC